MWQQMMTAAGAFSATNIDDMFILTLLFSRLDQKFRAIHVVSGQLIGFAIIVMISLSALAGHSLLPRAWLGLLGLLPISLGVSGLLETIQNRPASEGPGSEPQSETDHSIFTDGGGAISAIVGVATLTIANGSDNIGVYIPLFARATTAEVLVILITFALGLLLWCLLAWQLTRLPSLALNLQGKAAWLMPFVLIVLGVVIVLDSHCYEERTLAMITLVCLGVMTFSLLRQVEARNPSLPTIASLASFNDERI
jgi:cadmium resistance protein CadD (predicted permease)